MPKKPKANPSEKIFPTVEASVKRQLERLVPCGLYGGTYSEVAASLIVERLRELVRSGEFERLISLGDEGSH